MGGDTRLHTQMLQPSKTPQNAAPAPGTPRTLNRDVQPTQRLVGRHSNVDEAAVGRRDAGGVGRDGEAAHDLGQALPGSFLPGPVLPSANV